MDSHILFTGSKLFERHNDIGATVILGNQWGDEGKGKITDSFTQFSDVIVRFNGGHNAGHTVKVGEKEFDLHILPSGMISEGKINIITSKCVLGIDLNKIDMSKIQKTPNGLQCDAILDEMLMRKDGHATRVGMAIELEKLQQGGIDIKKSGLKISSEVIVIGMHNVLLDALDEKSREYAGLPLIGSTGSGISRGYASELQRYHFSLNDLLHNPDLFYASIDALWIAYKHIFKNITADDLIARMKKEREVLITYLKRGEVEIITHERDYIKGLHKSGKKVIGEGAQSSMIGSSNSFFGTASSPSLETFMSATGLTAKKIGNIILVSKMPPSSVGQRPSFLKYPTSDILDEFRETYREYGVSTKRPRDLFRYSLVETARGAGLNLRGIDDESKIVPVFNRVDGIADAKKLDEISEDKDVIRCVVGYSYTVKDILNETGTSLSEENIKVGIHGNEEIKPKTLLKNYPEKSIQSGLFGLTSDNLKFREIQGNIQEQIDTLLKYHLASIFRKNEEVEYIIGTGPKREDLVLKKGVPLRK